MKISRKNTVDFAVRLIQFQRLSFSLGMVKPWVSSLSEPQFPCIQKRARGGRIEFISKRWELHKTVKGKVPDIYKRRRPCVIHPRSEDPHGKIPDNSGRTSTCLVGHWKCWDRSHCLDTKARLLFLGGKAAQRSRGVLLWRTWAEDCPAHVIFAYHSNLSQSPLEISDWFHWWLTPATCIARSRAIDIWVNL